MSFEEDNFYAGEVANFSLRFLRQTFKKECKTMLISPLLIAIDLAIIYNGAADETANQIAEAITQENACLKLNRYFIYVWRQLQKQKSSLTTLNRIYVKQNIGIDERFLNIAEKYYSREVKSLNFNICSIVQNEINDSIEDETNGLIKEFIPDNFINKDISLMLINILNFHGEFATHFMELGPYSTPEEFYVKRGVIRYVYMLDSKRSSSYLYENAKDYEVLGIPYTGSQILFIVLPKEKYGLFNVIKNLDGKDLLKLAQNKEKKTCEVKLPRFKLNFCINTKNILKHLGIKNVFNPKTANFSNLSPEKSVSLHNILHGASITVFENGNESSFMSCRPSFGTNPICANSIPDPEIVFTADHPFLYFIADKNSTILMIGTIVDEFQDSCHINPKVERRQHGFVPNVLDQTLHIRI